MVHHGAHLIGTKSSCKEASFPAGLRLHVSGPWLAFVRMKCLRQAKVTREGTDRLTDGVLSYPSLLNSLGRRLAESVPSQAEPRHTVGSTALG
jgi:hypothetical protein